MDVIYIGLAILFFAVTALLVRFFEGLEGG